MVFRFTRITLCGFIKVEEQGARSKDKKEIKLAQRLPKSIDKKQSIKAHKYAFL